MQTLPERVARAAMQVMAGYLAIAVCPTQKVVRYNALNECRTPGQCLKRGTGIVLIYFFCKRDDCMLTILQMYPYLYMAHSV